MQSLKGKVAVVAGATRGAGRGIACMLGEQGATVYCTGRSTRDKQVAPRGAGDTPFTLATRPETIEETAELVTRYGGEGLYARVDYSQEAEVQAFFERVRAEGGRLDILVNDVWGGDELTFSSWGTPFWELPVDRGWLLQERAVRTHILAARYAAPIMVAQRSGLIVEIGDGDNRSYRGSFYYDLSKASVARLAMAFAAELKDHGVTALYVTPGFLRSEAMLEQFGVSEADWRDAAAQDPHFIASETPFFVGRAVAALAADPNVQAKSGGIVTTWALSDEYGFSDIDGNRPHWGRYFAQIQAGGAQ
jgi:NAD(P)-dependent dehydrogenase (short-subunit alcohol dehydrogenase family)